MNEHHCNIIFVNIQHLWPLPSSSLQHYVDIENSSLLSGRLLEAISVEMKTFPKTNIQLPFLLSAMPLSPAAMEDNVHKTLRKLNRPYIGTIILNNSSTFGSTGIEGNSMFNFVDPGLRMIP